MAKRYLRWNGGTSGDLNVGVNYEVDGVPEATGPIAGDELTFSGTPDLTPATNFAALTALLLDKVTIDQSYSLELGDFSIGNALHCFEFFHQINYSLLTYS